MSRSRPNTSVSDNPSKRFMRWAGAEGKVTYYDKEAEENIEVKLPLVFLVLDQLHTITGFNSEENAGFWSNEVRDLQNEELSVKTKSGAVAKGLYADIKEEIVPGGAKYAQSVYVAFKDEEGMLQISNFQFSGAALKSWIEFNKGFKRNEIFDVAIKLTGGKKAKKGRVVYFTPEFEAIKISEQTEKQASALDKQLQNYLDRYFSGGTMTKADIAKRAPDDQVAIEDIDEDEELVDENDGKINTADVPF